MRGLALALLAAVVLPGCSLLAEPAERRLEGPTDGHQPTATYLKVFVHRDDGTLALLNFERRDWHVSEIAKRIDRRELEYLGADVMPRHTLNEYVVQRVVEPAELEALRYDTMGASPQARSEMDAEYEEILRRALGAPLPDGGAKAAPPLLPEGTLP